MERRLGGLDIEQDLRSQRGEWLVQRISWAVMVLLVLAGLAGVFGSGPMSSATASSPDGSVSVDYGRFARFKSPEKLRVTVRPEAASKEDASKRVLRVQLSSDYLKGVQIQRIVPEPDAVQIGEQWTVFLFPLLEASAPATVTVYLKADAIGRLKGQVKAGNAQAVTINQFIYP